MLMSRLKLHRLFVSLVEHLFIKTIQLGKISPVELSRMATSNMHSWTLERYKVPDVCHLIHYLITVIK